MKRSILGLAAWLLLTGVSLAQTAVLLPNGRQQFLDSNGDPLASGTVGMYIPSTLTDKTTWQDAAEATPNINPVELDSAGTALIYGNGTYRQLVKDALGNTIWDALTTGTPGPFPAWGGTSGGTGDAPEIDADSFTATAGAQIAWRVGISNTTAVSITVGSDVFVLYKNSAAGPVTLAGGDLVVGNIVEATYDSVLGALVLVAPPSQAPGFGEATEVAVDSTTDIAVPSHFALITGSGATITSFGTNGDLLAPFYWIQFSGVNTLEPEPALHTPGEIGITTADGDMALVALVAIDEWRIVQYTKATHDDLVIALQPGALYGCALSNDAGTPASIIDIAACTTRDSTNAVNMVQASAFTKAIGTAWSVGTGGGSLDTGAVANTTYHLFQILRTHSGLVDYLTSVSATAPTLPTGYEYFRRIGSFTRAAGSVVGFVQDGDTFWLKIPTQPIAAANPGTSAVTRTLTSVPTGIIVSAMVGHGVADLSIAAATYGLLSPLSTTDTAPSISVFDAGILSGGATADTSGSYRTILTNTSAQIRSRISNSDADVTEYINLFGWVDSRGRLAP